MLQFFDIAVLHQVRLDTARAKAESILEAQGTEGGGRSKAREINALYAKARAGKGAGKSKASRSSKMKAKGPRLDKRMLSDKRQVGQYSYHNSTVMHVSRKLC